MKLSAIVLLVFAASAASAYFFWYRSKPGHHSVNSSATLKKKDRESEATFIRLKQRAVSVRSFMNDHNYNSSLCFLIDMRLHSGKNRFFVYNLEKDSIEAAGLVTHGSGSNMNGTGLSFSNIPNSNCTSLGKYKIGKSYTGKFGLAYKLYGLDNSNNRAYDRFVVLHSHDCVPTEEIAPLSICESWGCPTVAPAFLQKLKGYIDVSPRPLLLWIYY